MRIETLRIGAAPIPFRFSFTHAAAARNQAENVLVEARDADGRVGLGEGCPRAYVTGETVAGATAFLTERRAELAALQDLPALKAWIEANGAAIDANPSAFCAAELALLDVFARQAEQDIEAFLGIAHTPTDLRVSAVYGAGGAAAFRVQSALFGLDGMRTAKLKLSGDLARDRARARALARRGAVRLDANNLWPDAGAAMTALTALAPFAWAVEEPIRPRDWEGLRRIGLETGLAIILDESLLTLRDLAAAPRDIRIVPNLRVSKLGGLLRSLSMLVPFEGPVIVGAQVGETSILARAGLALARAAGARLAGLEIAYAPLLLSRDVVRNSVGFSYRGAVKWCSSAAGLGLDANATFQRALFA
ncbi:MAG TPA: enolase C-terminal domain-like protein [Vitreimonas sp.]|uniref:enolase C-terminal domain-like protein n=1 Tax=Vitreimonas sp. TaxID=3069702 RepID=UPI002D697ABE|nr:enolase C-terminal domain-like protein [Vitreimonas sp.]HYD86438.1 enolase C-terminal domain-like protein [Vitreimonas sp.]